MNHPRKSHRCAECPDTWGSDRDRPEALETDHIQKRMGDKTSFFFFYAITRVALLEKFALFSVEARRGAGHRTLLMWLPSRELLLSPVRLRPIFLIRRDSEWPTESEQLWCLIFLWNSIYLKWQLFKRHFSKRQVCNISYFVFHIIQKVMRVWNIMSFIFGLTNPWPASKTSCMLVILSGKARTFWVLVLLGLKRLFLILLLFSFSLGSGNSSMLSGASFTSW